MFIIGIVLLFEIEDVAFILFGYRHTSQNNKPFQLNQLQTFSYINHFVLHTLQIISFGYLGRETLNNKLITSSNWFFIYHDHLSPQDGYSDCVSIILQTKLKRVDIYRYVDIRHLVFVATLYMASILFLKFRKYIASKNNLPNDCQKKKNCEWKCVIFLNYCKDRFKRTFYFSYFLV